LLSSRRYRTLHVETCLAVNATMVSNSKGKQAQITSYYDTAAVRQLKRLSEATRVAQAVYLREALEDLLKKYAATVKKAK
jgi:hypothetical protein